MGCVLKKTLKTKKILLLFLEKKELIEEFKQFKKDYNNNIKNGN